MNMQELKMKLYEANYPTTYEVDKETYELAEKTILEWIEKAEPISPFSQLTLKIGPNGGIMFKNVELLIKR